MRWGAAWQRAGWHLRLSARPSCSSRRFSAPRTQHGAMPSTAGQSGEQGATQRRSSTGESQSAAVIWVSTCSPQELSQVAYSGLLGILRVSDLRGMSCSAEGTLLAWALPEPVTSHGIEGPSAVFQRTSKGHSLYATCYSTPSTTSAVYSPSQLDYIQHPGPTGPLPL